MRKRIYIALIIIVIIIGAFTYYSTSPKSIKEPETIIKDKDGKIVEPMDEDSDNIGHE